MDAKEKAQRILELVRQVKAAKDGKPEHLKKFEEGYKKDEANLKKHREKVDKQIKEDFDKDEGEDLVKKKDKKSSVTDRLIRLAFKNEELRPQLLPLIT